MSNKKFIHHPIAFVKISLSPSLSFYRLLLNLNRSTMRKIFFIHFHWNVHTKQPVTVNH